jgi:hypothetical protein
MPEAKKRHRRMFSVSHELVEKSREAALAAVQIFNNPQVTFKSEIFIVMMNIAWTYLLHAYYRKRGIEYRYFELKSKVRRFDRTKSGAYKFWELERCLNDQNNPVDKDSSNNLRFLIGIRHEIEHQMTTRIDATLSAKFQACCLNYNDYVKKLFGNELGIEKHLAFSLQFSSISREQADTLATTPNLPGHIKSFVEGFEGKLSDEEFNSPKFAYRVLFVAKTANRKGQADQVVEFVKADSDLAKQVNATYVVTKETERPKYRPGNIVAAMQKEGFKRFNMHAHTELWKAEDAKNPGFGLGVLVEGSWYWYEPWLEKVRAHCKANEVNYK